MSISKPRGFSLIELLVTLTIIGILTAIAMPAYEGYMNRSRRAEAMTALLRIASQQEVYRTSNPSYATDLSKLGYSGAATDSESGYYRLTISAASASTFTATATAQGVQSKDSDCPVFTITQSGPAGSRSCWGN